MARVDGLLWFHSFNRGDPAEIVLVVTAGPHPNPSTTTTTYHNETVLGLNAHVYAYLGRTVDKFGDRAIVVARDALKGAASPFDSGGLVGHIPPVAAEPAARKIAFLHAFTWSTDDLDGLLAQYPSDDWVEQYIAGERPLVPGPHAVLQPAVCGPEFDTWSHSANSWPAWTWEGRSESRIEVGDKLCRWTCKAVEYADLCFDDVASEAIAGLSAAYVRGGVSILVARLAEMQEKAA